MICHPELQRRICSLLKIKRFAYKLGGTDGAEIAEAAMVLPLVFMLLLGIIWFGRAFNIYSTITQAAQQGAITAARSSCVTCGNDGATDTTVDGVIVGLLQANNLEPGQIKSGLKPVLLPCPAPPASGSCGKTGNNIWLCRNMQLNQFAGVTQPLQCGTVVSFEYPFDSYLPFTSLNLKQIIMPAQAQSRMEN
jgi:hypothetical protein